MSDTSEARISSQITSWKGVQGNADLQKPPLVSTEQVAQKHGTTDQRGITELRPIRDFIPKLDVDKLTQLGELESDKVV